MNEYYEVINLRNVTFYLWKKILVGYMVLIQLDL